MGGSTPFQGSPTPEEFYKRRKADLERDDYSAVFLSFTKASQERLLEIMTALKEKCRGDSAFSALTRKELKLTKNVDEIPPKDLGISYLRESRDYSRLVQMLAAEEDSGKANLDVEVVAHTRTYITLRLVKVSDRWFEDYEAYKEEINKIRQSIFLITELENAIKEYSFETGNYPPSGNEELVKALKTPLGNKKRPFFDFSNDRKDSFGHPCYTTTMLNTQGQLLDPWGTPLRYYNNKDGSVPKDRKPANKLWELYSCGPNRKDNQGAIDDLTAW